MGFYASTSDAALAKELLAGCAELYIQEEKFRGTGVYNAVGGGLDEFQLTDDIGVADDAYNSSAADNLYFIDDNSKLAYAKISDTVGGTGDAVVIFDVANAKLVEDGITAPTMTDGTSYTVKVLSGSNTNEFGDYFGYTGDDVEFDSTPETEPLEVCNIEGAMTEIDEVVTKANNVMNGSSYNIPNSDIISKILNAQQYGLNNATQDEYHGGSAPDISTYYEITAKMKDREDKFLYLQIFRAQLLTNGAIALSGAGWKFISFTAKGKRDNMRDSYEVDSFRILRKAS